jgi:hypothetical protein
MYYILLYILFLILLFMIYFTILYFESDMLSVQSKYSASMLPKVNLGMHVVLILMYIRVYLTLTSILMIIIIVTLQHLNYDSRSASESYSSVKVIRQVINICIVTEIHFIFIAINLCVF